MRTPDRMLRLEAAVYEINRAATEVEAVATDKRHTDYRRQLARNQAALAYAMLALANEWRRLDAAMYPEQASA